jgi:hypothetical protein
MSNQIQITGGAKVRNLEGVLTGTSGIVSSLGINVPSGIPQLDGSGKILVSQLPNSVMEYKGTWDASTNTPTLVDGTGNAGDVYLCNVAGTVNFGAGPITFYVGDQVLYSGTVWQRASGATGSVTSVALTESGDALNITGSPITTSGTINIGFNGTSGQYINGAGNLTTFPSLTGYVPYSGATQSVILGEWGLRSGYLSLDTTPTGTPTTVGTMAWDTTYLTPSVITGTGNTTLQIGQEEVVLIHNNTGSTLTDGQVVYINGSTGNLPTVALADASDESTSAATLGVVTETITNGSDGFITISGNVNGLNTLAYTAGDILWLSETAGQFTNVKPISPAHLVLIGYVVKVSGGNGSILVKIQNTQELEECSDVLFTSLTNNDVLAYESSTDLWKNKSIPTVLGYTPLSGGGTAGNIPYYTGTYTLGSENGFMYDSSTNRFGVNTTVPNATIGANASIDSGYSLLLKNADANYNGLGFGLDSTYGNIITTQKIGTAAARNFTLQNQSGYVSIDESGNFGVNILTPKGGVDIYSSTTAALYLHNSASGVAATDGVRLSLNSTNANLRNYEAGTLSMTSEGDFSIITAATENFRVNSADGSIYQSKVANAMLKSVSGVITAAVAGTDYQTPITNPVSGTGTATRVAFWTASNTISSNTNLYWDNTNARLGIGLTNPQRALEIYSATADSHLRLSGAAPSVSMGEAITGATYQAKFGLVTLNNNFLSGTVPGDFVMVNQTNNAIFFGTNGVEVMRMTSGGLSITAPKSQLTINGNTTNGAGILMKNTISGTDRRNWGIFTEQNVAGDFVIKKSSSAGGDPTTGDNVLSFTNTGAATFSSSVSATNYLASATESFRTYNDNGYISFFNSSNTTRNGYLQVQSTALTISAEGASAFMAFNTGGGSERMRITSGGNVGIGTTNPQAPLHVVGSSIGNTLRLTSKDNAGDNWIGFYQSSGTRQGYIGYGYGTSDIMEMFQEANEPIIFSTNAIERMRILSNGIIEFKSYGPNTNLRFTIEGGDTFNTKNSGSGTPMYLNYSGNGAIYAGAGAAVTLYAGSDERIKENINIVDSTLDKVLQLIPKTFNYKDVKNKSLYYGFTAQDMESVFPELVKTAKEDSMCNDEIIANQKSIESFGLVWASILTKAIQEQQAQIDELKAKIN